MTISSCNALMGKHINMSLSPSSGSLLSGQLKVQDSPSAGFWAASGSLDAALAATVNAIGFVSGNLVSEVSIAGSGRTAIQNDVDANEVVTDAAMSALGGIVNGSGVYQAFSGTNYIDGNASLSVDLTDLDAAIKTQENSIVSREAAISASYIAQIGATRASVISAVLDGAPGALDTLNELAAALGDDANYATTITNALAAKQTEIDALETSLGGLVNASGVYQAFSGTNYLDGNASIFVDLSDLDAAIATTQGDVDANEVVTDAVMSSLGGLVNGSGVRVNFSGTNYIDGNASLSVDLTDLDAAIKTQENSIVSREAAISASYIAQIGATRASVISAVLDGAPGALDTLNELAAALGDDANYATTITNALAAKQTEIDALETSLGGLVNASGVYQAFSGTNYLDGNASIFVDLSDLDAAIATTQGDVDANEVVTDAVMSSLGGLVNGSGVRVNFSGTNYIDGNASLSVDLTDLDQAIKDRADGLATLEGHLDNSNGFRVTSAAGAYRMSWGLNKPQMTMTLNADGETIDVCFDRGA